MITNESIFGFTSNPCSKEAAADPWLTLTSEKHDKVWYVLTCSQIVFNRVGNLCWLLQFGLPVEGFCKTTQTETLQTTYTNGPK